MNLKNKIFPFSFMLLSVLLAAVAGLQAQPKAKATTDAREITIGDQIKVWLEVTTPSAGDKVIWPQMPDTLNGLEIVEKGKVDTIAAKGAFTMKQKLLVTGFDSGQYYIPSFQFQVIAAGVAYQLSTDSIAVKVGTIAVDTTKAFKPIKDIVAVPFSIWDYWPAIVAALLLIGFGIFLWVYFYKNRMTKVPVSLKVPPERAHEKALRLLQELKAKQLWEAGRVKEYYSELTEITRTYLEERFDIAALEQTTDELLALLKKQNESRTELRKVRPELKLILRTADLAKFAKATPLPQEHSACMAAAVEVVQRTQMKTGEVAS